MEIVKEETLDRLVIKIDWRKVIYVGIQAQDRECLIAYMAGVNKALPSDDYLITMPCGGEMEIKTFEDIPKHSVPCACGRKDHWFIKYTGGKDGRE